MSLRLFLIAYILTFLSACGGGGDAAMSPPVTQVQTPTELRIIAGNGQSALPGISLPIAPMIEVLDSANTPIADVSVSFTIELGGGTIKQAQTKTDSMGRASSGAWVLGLAPGANILRARVGGLPSVDFTSLALSSSEQISISVLIPTPYQVINEEWSAQLSVESNYEIATVKGTLSSVPFTLSQQGPFLQNWEGALPAQNLSRGESFIILTATDVNSNIANTIIPVMIDHPPSIVITEPKDSKAATPKIFIQITGEDDDNLNQPTIGVYVDGQMVASSIGKISNEVDLSVFTGKTIEMNFCVQDSAGQSKCSSRKIFVENNTSLSNMIEFDGLVMDIFGTRVLYLETQEQLPTLKIFDSSTGLTEIVESSQYLTDNVPAKLTPFGAIYERENGTFRIVNEWHKGQLVSVVNSNGRLGQIKDGWALYSVWSQEYSPNILGTYLLDMKTATHTKLSNDVLEIELGFDGEYVHSNPNDRQIYRRKGFIVEPITNNYMASHFGPKIGEKYISYYKQVDTDTVTILNDGTSEIFLVEGSALYNGVVELTGAFVGYKFRQSRNAPIQLWRYGPSGHQQLTSFPTSSELESLATNGEAIIINGHHRYLFDIEGKLINVSSSNRDGRVLHDNGKFRYLLGRSIFDINP